MAKRNAGRAKRGELEKEICTAIAQRLAGALMLVNAAFADRMGVNLTDLKCVAILAETGPLTAGQLSELAGTSTPATSVIVNRLESSGIVRRERDASDRRRVILHLERDTGLASALAEHQRSLVQSMLAVMKGFSNDELALARDFISLASDALFGVAERMSGAKS